MVFSALDFIFLFLPIFTVVWCLIPKNYRPLWMLFGSLGFYIYGTLSSPWFIALLAASVMINYLAGRLMVNFRKRAKLFFVLGLIYNGAWLFLFKYLDFVLGTVSGITGAALPVFDLALPLGISFYTFQSISYLSDIYHERTEGGKNLLDTAVFIMMFPKLTSGPIARYDELMPSVRSAEPSLKTVSRGLLTFTLGLGMKVLLANRIGQVWSDAGNVGYDSISTPMAWLSLISYAMQLYFDFAGYSVMAIGLGEMLGFELPENFNDPYLSKSVTEFWRRWHITLGRWFKDYIYIPLGGSRAGSLKTIRNLLIVWLFTGLWHGADWSFVIWGLYLFLFILLEKLFLKKYLDRYPVFGHIYLVVVILLSWVFFAVGDMGDAAVFLMRLFGIEIAGANIFPGDFLRFQPITYILMAVGLLFCTGLPFKWFRKYKETPAMAVIMLAIFWFSVYSLYMSAGDPFMYFNF